jgi:DNA-binding MarR family transcriptional regulator
VFTGDQVLRLGVDWEHGPPPFEVKYLDLELLGKVAVKNLDVKTLFVKLRPVAKTQEGDHVDRWLETAWLQDIPNLDLEVEGIVDRMNGLSRRFKRTLNETIAEHGLSFEEWDVLGALRRAGPPFRRSAGELAKMSDLSSGAMTSRLDRLEKAGLVKRLPDPNDRRGVLVELTKTGERKWRDSAGAGAAREALIASALTEREKKELNGLLRRLMLEFERSEGKGSKKKA